MRTTQIQIVLLIALFMIVSCQNKKVESKPKKKIGDSLLHSKQEKIEDPREKAIRIAEEFIKRNGYTSEPAERENLSFETIEFSSNIDEILEQRHDTLEPKAYGVLGRGKGTKEGWTVGFRYNRKRWKDMSDKEYNTHGRAVTINKKFEDLLVEHKDFILKNAEKID